jgi:hypothetical protein
MSRRIQAGVKGSLVGFDQGDTFLGGHLQGKADGGGITE